jgi:hypothetical protein
MVEWSELQSSVCLMSVPHALCHVPQPSGFQAPSRREALFGLLGAGLGVGLSTVYYKSEWMGPQQYETAGGQQCTAARAPLLCK